MDDRRVGRLIRAARHRHGWRQVDVEAACGVDQTSVSLIERGHLRSFTLDTLTRVAEAVGVRLELQPRLTAAEVARLLDVQELLATLDRKCRLVPRLISSEGPWRPVSVGRLLIVEESSVARRIVTAHAATFGVALPARSRSVRAWITAPAGDLAGLWFVSGTNGGRTDRRRPGRRGGA